MTFNKIKEVFDNEWIGRLCDALNDPDGFINRNKIDILESLLVVIQKEMSIDEPLFNEQRECYLYILDCIERESVLQYARV